MNALYRMLLVLLAAFALAIAAAAQEAPAAELPTLADLQEGWNEIVPGGETGCAYGTPYSFHVRPADPDKLLIFFNGGGACWFGQICSPTAPTFVPLADIGVNIPDTKNGIFAFDNPDNPFSDFTVVFAPYCTGDVHMGSRVTEYPLGDQSLSIAHKGSINAHAVLDWTFANVSAPEVVFVTGSSAGAIPSPIYAGVVAEAYPEARVVQLGDGAGGYRVPDATPIVNTVWGVLEGLPDWEEFADETVEGFTFERYYIATAKRFPNITFAQYNTAHDDTQYQFLAILGMTDVNLLELLTANYDEIRAEVPTFYTYTAGGTLHTILRLPEFYTYEVQGVRLRDWVANLVAGEAVGDVTCEGDECLNPPATD